MTYVCTCPDCNGETMNEYKSARILANQILDRTGSADPDDNLAILARQLLRADEALLKYIVDPPKSKTLDLISRELQAARGVVAAARMAKDEHIWCAMTGNCYCKRGEIKDALEAYDALFIEEVNL